MSFSVKPVPKNSNIIFIIGLVAFALIFSSTAWAGKAIVDNQSSHNIFVEYKVSPSIFAPFSTGTHRLLYVNSGRTGSRDEFEDWTLHLIEYIEVAFNNTIQTKICKKSVPTDKKYYHTKVIVTDSNTDSCKCDISFW